MDEICGSQRPVSVRGRIAKIQPNSESDKRRAVKKTSQNYDHLEEKQVQYTPLVLSEKSHSSNAISQSVLPNQVDTENVKEL